MKSIILLSGGLDSTVCLKKAIDDKSIVFVLTFDYGQKAALREIEAAKKICSIYNVSHKIISLPFLTDLGDSVLTSKKEKVCYDNSVVTDVKPLWVPNRNGLFVNIGACFAEALGYDNVIAGFNIEEAHLFPDNSENYIKAANQALEYSTLSKVRLISYTSSLTKKEIVALGKKIDAPIEISWSCYEGAEEPCGKCPSCIAALSALAELKQ
ncbi:MAG: 7-cyano-7-deazaguanine synthase QueC [Planctomycetota bacterium]